MTGTGTATRRPRRDAAQNYQLVVDAARELLGEAGVDASMEQIAARAGVGVGTLYRRFPCKESLVEELVRLVTEELVLAGEQALAGPDGTGDDGTGLESFLREMGRSFAKHRHWVGLLVPGQPRNDAGASVVRAQIARLFTTARRAGTLGAHAELGDIMALIWGMRGLAATAGDVAPGAWERYLDIHLAGLRAVEAPSRRAAISKRQLQRLAEGDGSTVDAGGSAG